MMVEVYVLVVRQERPAAIQVITRDALPFFWIPRSQIPNGHDVHAGDRDLVIEIPLWLARKNGMVK